MLISISARQGDIQLSKVKTRFKPKPGLFTESAEEIARYLLARGKKKALARLIFYANRAGSNLSAADSKRIDKAIRIIKRETK